ncbi:SDR family oxidoreductase [Blastococcus goldschmidtiae]|uniref:SDR family oxidoreductase n=1 Tax=Blastococcus goldschmidtiae TaxID=3075546 RepID=A0ABU2K8Q7_9ACTN|nr:SDR family oxidoreductase [Blastococcus sp. DSM 46792]MDT0276553.1 SDR family oxidoreductase [Blastococcus sp. DSM 46792]
MSRGVVLITGASAGLGEEMARQFADLGYDLALCARRTERLDALAAEITARTGRRVETAALDVTDAAAVPDVFTRFAGSFGAIDRVVVNAGIGKGAALGTGRADANRATAMTNFVGALTQTEAALEIFRRQQRGHLVLISSMSALRGMRKAMTTYAATKAGVAALAEGLRSERIPGLDVSVIYPGYIRSEMNAHVAQKTRFMVDTPTGVRSMVEAIEKRRPKAYVPAWPWVPIGFLMKVLPLSVVRKLT